MIKKIMIGFVVFFMSSQMILSEKKIPEEMFCIFGFPKDTLINTILSSDFFKNNNEGSYFPWKYPVKGLNVSSLDDYVLARSRIVAASNIIKSLNSSISAKIYNLGLIFPLKPELSKELDGCEKLRYQDNPNDFIKCIEKSKNTALAAIEQTYACFNHT